MEERDIRRRKDDIEEYKTILKMKKGAIYDMPSFHDKIYHVANTFLTSFPSAQIDRLPRQREEVLKSPPSIECKIKFLTFS